MPSHAPSPLPRAPADADPSPAACNEFGFFQTADAKDQPFSAFGALTEATVGAAVCEAAFELPKGTRPDTAWANTNYGGRDLRAQNVTVPNGSLDPWPVSYTHLTLPTIPRV